MPRKSETRVAHFAGWAGGLNTRVPQPLLPEAQLGVLENFDIGLAGELTIRPGATRFDDGDVTIRPVAMFTTVISQLASGEEHGLWLMSSTGQIWMGYFDWLSTLEWQFSASGTNGLLDGGGDLDEAYGYSCVAAEGAIYITHVGSTFVYKRSGITSSKVTSIPRSMQMLYHSSRLFCLGTGVASNRVKYSDLLDAETFDANSYIDVGENTDYIRGGIVYGDDIYIFKDRSIWKLVGTGGDETSWVLYQVDALRGCTSGHTIRQIGDMLYFYDERTGVWEFDGVDFREVSAFIRDEILPVPTRPYLQNGSAVIAYQKGDSYVLSLTGEQTTSDFGESFVYDTKQQAWTKYTSASQYGIEWLERVMVASWNRVGVWMEDPDEDVHPDIYSAANTDPVPAAFETAWFRIGGPGSQGRIKRIELLLSFDDTLPPDVTIDLYADMSDTTALVSRSVTADNLRDGTGEGGVVSIGGWGTKLRTFKFKVSMDHPGSTTGEAPRIEGLSVFYTSDRDIMGERDYV